MSVIAKRAANGRPAQAASLTSAAPPEAAATAIRPVPFEHEELVVRRGRRSGACAVVAIHSTALGPALGGVRLWHYESSVDGVRDALRLARGMTYKAAAAGLELGGGKGVICAPPGAPPSGSERHDLLLDFGDLVESLDGRYITAEDVGITAQDLVAIGERTGHLTGLPPDRGGLGDPSPFTAAGVESAIRACLVQRFGSGDLAGRGIAVVGLGHVGEKLARRLADGGAHLLVSDIDAGKRGVARRLGAQWVHPREAMLVECDVLAPCALGGAIHADNAGLLRCQIVCGSANNQLAQEGLDKPLASRGIIYAPDFIVNAGGLIHVFNELRARRGDEAPEGAPTVDSTIERVLAVAAERSVTPLQAARDLAQERLDGARESVAVA